MFVEALIDLDLDS